MGGGGMRSWDPALRPFLRVASQSQPSVCPSIRPPRGGGAAPVPPPLCPHFQPHGPPPQKFQLEGNSSFKGSPPPKMVPFPAAQFLSHKGGLGGGGAAAVWGSAP